jgi:pilus assembly protein CpaB
MQKITRIAALLLVVLAFVFALLAFALGRHGESHTTVPAVAHAAAPIAPDTNSSGTPVVVATSALPAGQVIPFSSLQVVNQAQPPQGSFADIDAVAGHMPLVGIPSGTPITSALLAHGMSMQLIPGERALAIPIDEVAGVGNRIVPGDYVDVFMSLKNPAMNASNNHDMSQTRLLLSRLRVLAYGNQNLPVLHPVKGSADDQAAAHTDNDPARTAVLAVPVAEVDRLLLGAQNGKLTLALRYPGDEITPNANLFPQPPVVLAPLAVLSPEQHQSLETPENDAFAGIDGAGLSGQLATMPRVLIHRPIGITPGLEIIRGTQRSDAATAMGSRSP